MPNRGSRVPEDVPRATKDRASDPRVSRAPQEFPKNAKKTRNFVLAAAAWWSFAL